MVDLERDWRHLNISNLVRHRVPVAYPWDSSLAASPRFTALSPTVLRVYDNHRQFAREDVHSSALHGLDDEISMMLKFDDFFQELASEGRPDPSVEFDEDWEYYVVDFQGWSRRSIPVCVAEEYYIRFSSYVGHENGRTIVLFRRWEPLDNLPEPVQPEESMDVEGSTSMVRGSWEIRELHRSKHAPEQNGQFDWDGRPSRLQSSLEVPLRQPRPQHLRSRAGGSSSSRRWLAQMSSAETRSESSSQSGFRSSPGHSSNGMRSSTPSGSNSRQADRTRSASPRPQTYQHRRGTSPSLRRRAVEDLHESGAVITHADSVWAMPSGLEWNITFCQESVILFPDTRTLTRLRYWAIVNSEISHMRHLLELAIARNMHFVMATRFSDLKAFKPTLSSDLAELTKRTYEAGFQEEHLKDINGGAAFRDHYMGKLADILRRPHARALINMGGPAACIAKRYGGSAIVQRFMDGPSTQVTIHHRGAVASSPLFDDPLFHDQISAQEENLVHGFVPAENPEHHRWLFPTVEIMEDFCHHWSGEWTAGCDSIFHNIAKSLERGTAKPLTRKGWKSYLHSSNHGARRPTTLITSTHFSKVDELLLAFPDSWHGKRIADIIISGHSDSLSGN